MLHEDVMTVGFCPSFHTRKRTQQLHRQQSQAILTYSIYLVILRVHPLEMSITI